MSLWVVSHRNRSASAIYPLLGALFFLLSHPFAAMADVAPRGSFRTNIPIDVPPYHGLAPKMSLVYYSGAGNGFIGVGWILSGISSIQRASPGKGLPNYDANDIYLLDGMELIACSSIDPNRAGFPNPPSCSSPTSIPGLMYYTTKIESFQRIARSSTDEWYVWTKDGTKLSFETKVTSTVGGAIYRWHLSSVTDTLGNTVNSTYWCDGSQCYPDQTTYNSVKITFYREARSDVISYATGDQLASIHYRLKSIDIQVGGKRLRTYALSYTPSGTTGRSVLSSVQQFGRDADVDPATGTIRNANTASMLPPATRLPPASFTVDSATNTDRMGRFYQDPEQPPAYIKWANSLAGGYSNPAQLTASTDACREHAGLTWMSADVNGDGLQDWIYVSGPCLNSNRNKVFPPFLTYISEPDGNSAVPVAQRVGWFADALDTTKHSAQFFSGDYNSDGLTDIIGVAVADVGYYVFLVATSNGDGSYYYWPPTTTNMVAQKPVETAAAVVADFTISLELGPGFLLGHTGVGLEGNAGGVPFGASLGASVSPVAASVGVSAYVYGIGGSVGWGWGFAGGSGLQGGVSVSSPDIGNLSTTESGSGGETQVGASYRLGGGASVGASSKGASLGFSHTFWQGVSMWVPDHWFAADFNGDGKTDLALLRQECDDSGCQAVIYIYLADLLADVRGIGFFGVPSPTGWQPSSKVIPGWRWDDTFVDQNRFMLGDVNGDDRPDFMMVEHAPANEGGISYEHARLRVAFGGGSDGLPFTFKDFDTPVRWQNDDIWFPGDVNGDGKTDFMHIIRVPAGNGYSDFHGRFEHWISDGSGTFTATTRVETNWPWNLPRKCVTVTDFPMPWIPVDADGDGRTDLMHIFGGYPSRGCDSSAQPINIGIVPANGDRPYTVSTGSHFERDNPVAFFPGDLNGDGRSDLFYATATQVNDKWLWTLGNSLSQQNTGHDAFRWQPADVDGDGMNDLVYVGFRKPGVNVHTLFRRPASRSPDYTWEGPDAESHFLPPAQMSQVAGARAILHGIVRLPGLDEELSDRLELWAVDAQGRLFTTWKSTTDPNASWVPWEDFLAEVPLSAQVSQVAAASLPDGRLELWAVDAQGRLFTTWKSTTDLNASWVPWEDFLAEVPLSAQVSQVSVAPLADGRLELWAVDAQGRLFTTWKSTTDPNASWVPWEDFLAEVPLSAQVSQVSVAPLADGRLELWAVDAQGRLFTTWKSTADPNASWVPWEDFLGEVPLSAQVSQVAAAPLSDGGLELWAVDAQGRLFTTWKSTTDPNASWVPWQDFLAEVPLSAQVSQVAAAPLSDGRLELWAVDAQGRLFTTWKSTTGPNASWVPWEDFLTEVPPPGSFVNAHAAGWRVMDINGDGRSDLVFLSVSAYTSPTSVSVYNLVSSGHGWTEQQGMYFLDDSGNPNFPAMDPDRWIVGDVNGDGKEDLIHLYHRTWQDASGNYHSSLERRMLIADPSAPGGFREWPGNSNCPLEVLPDPGDKFDDVELWHPVDLNGDGLTDLVKTRYSLFRLAGGQYEPENALYVDALISQKGDACLSWRWVSTKIPDYPMQDALNWKAADVNGDGMADLVHIYRSGVDLMLDTLLFDGSGFQLVKAPRVAWPNYEYTDTGNWQALDVNQDGLADFVHVVRGTSGIKVDVLYSDGTGYYSYKRTDSWPGFVPSHGKWMPVSLTAEGKLELVHVWDLPSGDPSYPGFRVQILSQKGPWDLVTRVTSPQGGTTDVRYGTPIRSTYGPGCQMPVGSLRRVVTRVSTTDGRGTEGVQTYSYDCPYWSYSERAFVGWGTVSVADQGTLNRPTSIVKTGYSLTDQCLAQLFSTETIDGATGNRFWLARSDFLAAGFAPPYQCQTSRNWTYEYNLGSRPRVGCTELDHDGNGNVTNVYEYGTQPSPPHTTCEAFIPGEQRTTARGYTPNTDTYLVGLPSYEAIYEGIGTQGPMKSKTEYCYDGDTPSLTNGTLWTTGPPFCWNSPVKGLVTLTRELDDQHNVAVGGRLFPAMVETNLTYYPGGNLWTVKDANSHTTTIEYDKQYNLYPTKIWNALKQPLTFDWDYVIGQVVKSIDPNNMQTSMKYDALGRHTDTFYPNGGAIHRRYLDWGNASLQRVREWLEDGSRDGLWTESYFDGLGRVHRVLSKGDSSGVTFNRHTVYADAASSVYEESHPHRSGEAPVYEAFQYDGAGRLVSQTHADTSHSQLGWRYDTDQTTSSTTFWDERNHEGVSYTDVYGRTVKVRQKNQGQYSYSTYQYDVLNRLTGITDSAGNVSTMSWDSLGRRISSNDPDMGHWTYRYDDVGNLLYQTDARGITTYWTYDELNRKKTEQQVNPPDGEIITWNYDEKGHGDAIGMLTSVSDPTAASCRSGLADSFSYDVKEREVEHRKCVLAIPYKLTFRYDKVGRLKSITYPPDNPSTSLKNETVEYGYDPAGRLSRVSHFVNLMRYDAAGKLRTVDLPNRISETFDYDSNRDWLDAASFVRRPCPVWAVLRVLARLLLGFQLPAPKSRTIYELSYQHFPDALISHLEEKSSSPKTQDFGYDGLHRLQDVTGSFSRHFDYNDLGNVTLNSAIGKYWYPPSGPDGCGAGIPCAHPHAVTQAGAFTYGYDENGNMNSRNGKTVKWDYRNLVQKLQNGNGAWASFRYDSAGGRVHKEASSGTSYYFGPYLEQKGTAVSGLLKYYYAGPLLVARKDSSGRKIWFHQDHLGSTRLLTGRSGKVVQQYDYKAFGETANLSSSTDAVTDIRYTGQRTEDETNLVYLNARYYDPVLARFMSPDSVVPQPLDPQQLNRYSYAQNNPVNYSDPSGHQTLADRFNNPEGMGMDLQQGVAWAYDESGYLVGLCFEPEITSTPPPAKAGGVSKAAMPEESARRAGNLPQFSQSNLHGYEYRKDTIIGTENPVEMVPGHIRVMMALQSNPSAFFPFDVRGNQGESGILLKHEYNLVNKRDRLLPFFLPSEYPVRVTEVTPTSFTFSTLPGHFDPLGSTVIFTTWVDLYGKIHLEQHGKTTHSSRADPLLILAPVIAGFTWDIQAANLSIWLQGGEEPWQQLGREFPRPQP